MHILGAKLVLKKQQKTSKKDLKSSRRGFALATVLSASVAMLTVLTVAITLTTTIHTSLRRQQYALMVNIAKESGVAYAKACIAAQPESYKQWSDDKPLTPETDCVGAKMDGASDYVLNDSINHIQTSFKVTSADVQDGEAVSVNVSSALSLNRKTSNLVWKTYSSSGSYIAKTITTMVGWKQVSAGNNRTCAISTNDKLYCWGNNVNGEFGDKSSSQNPIPTEVYSDGVLKNKKIIMVSNGMSHVCAITDDYQAYCWGYGLNGRLGDGAQLTRTYPVAVAISGVAGLKGFKSIATGGYHTCAISTDDKPYCWGANTYGQLGNNSTSDSLSPVLVSGGGVLDGKAVISIAVGQKHTCALTSDNKLYCWGYNGNGELGNGQTVDSPVPVEITSSGDLAGRQIKAISSKSEASHTCAIAVDISLGNQVYCWGYGYYGQLGNSKSGNLAKSISPTAIVPSSDLRDKAINSVIVGSSNTCVLSSGAGGINQAYCWGQNDYGQVGTGSRSQLELLPNLVNGEVTVDKSVISISIGNLHGCMVVSNGKLYCWGRNSYGQLGADSYTDTYSPALIKETGYLYGKSIKSIAADGYFHSCAIADDNLAYCWGDNNYGQLGIGTVRNSRVPEPVYVGTASNQGVLYGKTIKSIVVSRLNAATCAIAADSSSPDLVYCWGRINDGTLATGSRPYSVVPYQVDASGTGMENKSVKQISMGRDYACAVLENNEVYCWGNNKNGKLGDGTVVSSAKPVKVVGLDGKTIESISSGWLHTCVLDSTGDAYCWGENSYHVLGNDSTTGVMSATPVKVSNSGLLSGKTILSISAGDYFTCVVASDNQAYCWGYNGQYQLGNSQVPASGSQIPVKVTSDALDQKSIKSVVSGSYNACLLTTDDQAYCWGDNGGGQLGSGVAGGTTGSPVKVNTAAVASLAGKTVKSISVGQYDSCLVSSDDKAYCWGYYTNGVLGNNSLTARFLPTALFTALDNKIKYSIQY